MTSQADYPTPPSAGEPEHDVSDDPARCRLCGKHLDEDYDALAAELAKARELLQSRNCDDLCLEHIKRATTAESALASLRAGVQDMVDHGLRFDLTPTHDLGHPEEFWHQYAKRMDEAIRERAEAMLSAQAGRSEG